MRRLNYTAVERCKKLFSEYSHLSRHSLDETIVMMMCFDNFGKLCCYIMASFFLLRYRSSHRMYEWLIYNSQSAFFLCLPKYKRRNSSCMTIKKMIKRDTIRKISTLICCLSARDREAKRSQRTQELIRAAAFCTFFGVNGVLNVNNKMDF